MARKQSNQIRIIAGEWRGRKLPVADVEGLRPTIDRVRETLFNWLMYDVRGARCLDLFAGTGVLGMECLSRGASSVQFVEANHKAGQQLRQNLSTLSAENAANIHIGDASVWLNSPAQQTFDLVFLDPPFALDVLQQTCHILEQQGWLAANAKIYIERDRSSAPLKLPQNWQQLRSGSAGQSDYELLQRGLSNK